MHDDTVKKQKIHPVTAGIAGVAAGTIIGAGAATVLRNKKVQEKVKKIVTTTRKKAGKYMDTIQSQAKETIAEKADETERELRKNIEKVKKATV